MRTLQQVCVLAFVVVAALFAPAAIAQDGIPDKFTQPEGWQWGRFTNAEDAAIRFGYLRADNPRAVAVVVTGFREFGEKYFEVVRDLHERNFDVWQMDWRGQGGSDHYLPDTDKTWYQGYDRDADDLEQFATEIVERPDGMPMFVVAHSMGGHIALRHLRTYPETFEFAVMTAPMLRINTGGIPKWVAKPLAWGGNIVSAEAYIIGGTPWEYDPNFAVEDSSVSQDPVRYRVGQEYMRLDPALQLGSATYGWIRNAFREIAELNEESYLSGIAAPVLIASPRNDQIVLPEAHDRACPLMKACVLFPIPDSKHEVWMERDDFRDPWWARVDTFVDEQLNR
jgi:lysophospholipase